MPHLVVGDHICSLGGERVESPRYKWRLFVWGSRYKTPGGLARKSRQMLVFIEAF